MASLYNQHQRQLSLHPFGTGKSSTGLHHDVQNITFSFRHPRSTTHNREATYKQNEHKH